MRRIAVVGDRLERGGEILPGTYDEQFRLVDARGALLRDTYYTARVPSGERRHGVTNPHGRTERYKTKDAQSIRIYLGHREKA